MDIIALSSTTVIKSVEFGEKMQNKGYYGIQGHRARYQSKAICY